MSDAFISYSRKNTEFTMQIVGALRDRSYDYWLDERDAHRSPDWWSEIQAGINSADNFLFVLSQESLSSSVCHLELAHALSLNKRIIVIALKDKPELNLAQALGVVAADDDPITREMAAGKDVLMIARDNWGALNKPTWIFFRPEDDFEDAFRHLMEVLETDHRHVRMHTRLLERAEEWNARSREKSLLLIGTELEEAKLWLQAADEEQAKMPRPTETQREYIALSDKEEKRRIEEEKRRSSELHAAKEQAEDAVAQARAAAERAERATAESNAAAERAKRARRFTILVGGLAAIAVIAVSAVAGVSTAVRVNSANATLGAINETVEAAQRESDALEMQILSINSRLAGRQGMSELGISQSNDTRHNPAQNALGLSLEAFSHYPTIVPPEGGSLLAYAFDRIGGTVIAAQNLSRMMYSGALSQDRRRFLAALTDSIALGDMIDPQNLAFQSLPTPTDGVVWSSDGSYFVTWDWNGVATIRRGVDGAVLVCAYHTYGSAYNPYQIPLDGAALSPDATGLAAWSNDAGVRIWHFPALDSLEGSASCPASESASTTLNRNISQEITVVPDTIYVDSVVWSGDGTRLLVSFTDGDGRSALAIFDAASGEEMLSLREDYYIGGAQWIADDSRVMTWGGYDGGIGDNAVHVWDTVSGSEIYSIVHSESYRVMGAQLSEDNTRLLTWDDGGLLFLWELGENGAALTGRAALGGVIMGAEWSDDGSRVLVWSDSQSVNIFNTETMNLTNRLSAGTTLLGAAWVGDDGQDVLTWDGTGLVQIWSFDSTDIPRSITRLQHDTVVAGAGWSPDGSHVLAYTDSGEIHVWDSSTGDALFTIAGEFANSDLMTPGLYSVSWTDDGRYFLTWDYFGDVRLYDGMTGESLWERPHMPTIPPYIDERAYRLPEPVFSRGSDRAATWMGNTDYQGVALDPSLSIWAVPSGELIAQIDEANNIAGAIWNQDDSRLLTWSYDGVAQIWDAASGALIQEFQHPDIPFAVPLSGARWNADESQVLTWTQDGVARVWDAASGAELLHMRHLNTINGAVWNADQTRILTSSLDRTAAVWDAQTGQRLFTMEHDQPLRGAMYSSDGALILTWSNDGHARLWNAEDGSLRRDLIHDEYGYALLDTAAFSPDGSSVLTAGSDGRAVIWDTASGMRQYMLTHDYSNAYRGAPQWFDAAWSPDGAHVLTYAEDTQIRLWLVDMPRMVTYLQTAAPTLDNAQREAFDLPTLAPTLPPLPTATLTPLALGTAHVGRQAGNVLDDAGNVWEYAGQAGEAITITIFDAQSVSGLDSFLLVYAPDGQLIAANDDLFAYESTDSFISSLVLPLDGIYRIEVREFPDGWEYYGSYTLDIISSRITPTPSIVPSITPSLTPSATPSATPTMRPTPQAGVGGQDGGIPYAGSETWLYEGGEGEIVTITVIYAGTMPTSMLEVLAPDGQRLANDENANDYLLQVREITLPQTGTYLVRVSRDEAGYRGWSDYTLDMISSLITPTPTPTPSQTPTIRPTPTAVAGDQTGFIPMGGGESWLYEGQAGDTVTFSVFAENSAWDTYLYLYSPDGLLLASNDDFVGLNSQIDVALPQTGIYRLEVRSFADASGGNYDLSITAQSTAVPVTPSS